MSKMGHRRLGARFCVTIRLMRGGPSNRLAGAGLKPPSAAAPYGGGGERRRDLKKNLYRIWNRMSSGSYFPSPVGKVKLPKANGGERTLGIPAVSVRIAQMVVKNRLEAVVDPLFLPASYGYRPNKSTLDAVRWFAGLIGNTRSYAITGVGHGLG